MIFKSLLTVLVLGLTVCHLEAASISLDTTEEQAQYLLQFGYLDEIPVSRSGASDPEFSEAVKDFQRYAGLPETGAVDEATKAKMNSPRCGYPDNRYDARTGWGYTDLTYRIDSYPTYEVSEAEVDQSIALAFKYWSDQSPLTFTRKYSGVVDIEIIFVTGDHGDGYAFDGWRGVLAHAYFPRSGSTTVDGLWGDAHFDIDEMWTIGVYSGINLLQVAVHEFGHSLGLGHSSEFNAIMYPYYRGYVPNMQLDSDDIAGIQHLYGPPASETTTKASTPTPEKTTEASTPTSATTSVAPEPTTTAPTECQNGYYKFTQTRRLGGKNIAGKDTHSKCQTQCTKKDKCWGFLFMADNLPTERCYIFQLETYSSSTYDFYLKGIDGGYSEYESLAHRKGISYVDYLTHDDCEYMCDNMDSCVGFTVQRPTTDGQQIKCRLHIYAFLPTGENSHNYFHKC